LLSRQNRQAVAKSDEDVKSFVCDDFYVDDGLTSLTDKEQAIKLVKRTQKSLMDNGHIRLHKIVSNNVDVMKAFSTDELGRERFRKVIVLIPKESYVVSMILCHTKLIEHLFNITCNCHCIFTKTRKYSNQVVSEIRSGHQKTIRDGIYFDKILVSEYKLFKRSNKANLFIALVQ
jgi:hypothetical protein